MPSTDLCCPKCGNPLRSPLKTQDCLQCLKCGQWYLVNVTLYKITAAEALDA